VRAAPGGSGALGAILEAPGMPPSARGRASYSSARRRASYPTPFVCNCFNLLFNGV